MSNLTLGVGVAVAVLLCVHAVSVRFTAGRWPDLRYDLFPHMRRRALDDVLLRYATGEYLTARQGLRAYERCTGGGCFLHNYITPIYDAAWREQCRRNGWEYAPLGAYGTKALP